MEIKKHKNIIAILTALFVCSNAFSQKWVSLDGNKSGKEYTISIIESDVTKYKAKISIHGFYDREIVRNETVYHQLFFNDGFSTHEVGEPQLPAIGQLIAIPAGATYKVTVLEERWQEIEIGRVFPAQAYYTESEKVPDFSVNNSIYEQNEYIPALIYEGKEDNWRHIRNVGITVCPFKYYPTRNKISVLTDFVLQVDFMHASKQSSIRKEDLSHAASWGMFANNITTFPIEDESENTKGTLTSNDYDYLIIVGNIPSILNSQALQDFCLWKNLKGYKTKVVSTTTICNPPYYNYYGSIKNFIKQELDNYHIRYVLLVGDINYISLCNSSTPYETGGVYGDYGYGCTGGPLNYTASIPIGRFSVNKLSEFENMVAKTIAYEKSFSGDYSKVLLAAHKETAPENYQNCCNNILTGNYSTPLNFTTAYGGAGATNSQVVNAINNGMHIVNYRGHGLYYGWQNGWNNSGEQFDTTQINNINTTAIYINACCFTGKISEEPCFMETFTRSSKGAVACIAATDGVHPSSGSLYDQKIFQKLFYNNVWNIGNLNLQAHFASFPGNIMAQHIAFLFLLGADPTLEIWTGTPNNYSNVSITKSGSSMTVSSPSFCSSDTISVVSEAGELLARYSISGSSCTFTIPSGNFYFAVNRHNYYPYVTYCSTSGYIQNKTIDVNSYYDATPMNVGYDVTSSQSYGNVKVKSGSRLTIKKGSGGVTIKNGFECEQGAEMVIE